MNDVDFDPLLWFVCRACRQVFPDTDKLKKHKLRTHYDDYMKVKCIIFEERLLDNQWIPKDNIYLHPNPESAENEILPEKLYCHCDCTASVTISPCDKNETDRKPLSNPEPDIELKVKAELKPKPNPYVAIKRLTAHEINKALKFRHGGNYTTNSEDHEESPLSKKQKLSNEDGEQSTESIAVNGSTGQEFTLTDFSTDPEGKIQFKVRLSTSIFEDENIELEDEPRYPVYAPFNKPSLKRFTTSWINVNNKKEVPELIDLDDDAEDGHDIRKSTGQNKSQNKARLRRRPNQTNSGNSAFGRPQLNQHQPRNHVRDSISLLIDWLNQKQNININDNDNSFEFQNKILLDPDLTAIPVSAYKKISKNNPVSCKLCRKKLVAMYEVSIHALNCWLHNKDRHIFCIPCKKQFSNPRMLSIHNVKKHSSSNRSLLSPSDLLALERNQSDDDNDIEATNASVAEDDNFMPLNAWIEKRKLNYPDPILLDPDPTSPRFATLKMVYPLQCKLCREKLHTEIFVRIHLLTCWAYNKAKHRYCNKCNITFSSTTFLQKHIVKDHSKGSNHSRWMCECCSMEFGTAEGLQEHKWSLENFCRVMQDNIKAESMTRFSSSIVNVTIGTGTNSRSKGYTVSIPTSVPLPVVSMPGLSPLYEMPPVLPTPLSSTGTNSISTTTNSVIQNLPNGRPSQVFYEIFN